MNNNKEFIWTDELVKEFMITYNKVDKLITGVDPIIQTMQEWKEAKQLPNKDYEILSMVSPINEEWTCDSDMFEWYMGNGWKINQVKRLSDNKVFTVGEEVEFFGKIKEFVIEDNYMKVHLEDSKSWSSPDLSKLKKAKERILLFTTEQIEEIILIVRQQLKIHDES